MTALDATILVNFLSVRGIWAALVDGDKIQFFVCDKPGPKQRLYSVHGTQLYNVISRGVFSMGDVEPQQINKWCPVSLLHGSPSIHTSDRKPVPTSWSRFTRQMQSRSCIV